MKPVPMLLVFALACAFVSAVMVPQNNRLPFIGKEASALVELRGSLDFSNFVPDVENRANITVALALPTSALASVSSGNLAVYVLLQPERNDSLLYFGGNPGAKSYYLTLNCTVQNGECTPGSVVERTIGVYFKASNSTPLEGDGIILLASVNPLISEQLNVSEIALNQSAYDSVGDLQTRILRAASGIFGLVGQAANATTGVLSDISITVTTNNSSQDLSAINGSSDPLLIAAAQAADDAKKSILEGDYERARLLSNQSEFDLEQYAKQQAASKQSSSVSAGMGIFFGALAKPEVTGAILIIGLAAFVAIKYKDRLGNRKKGRGHNGTLDFDGL